MSRQRRRLGLRSFKARVGSAPKLHSLWFEWHSAEKLTVLQTRDLNCLADFEVLAAWCGKLIYSTLELLARAQIISALAVRPRVLLPLRHNVFIRVNLFSKNFAIELYPGSPILLSPNHNFCKCFELPATRTKEDNWGIIYQHGPGSMYSQVNWLFQYPRGASEGVFPLHQPKTNVR